MSIDGQFGLMDKWNNEEKMPITVNIYCVTSLDRGLLRAILAVKKSGAILDGVDFLLV